MCPALSLTQNRPITTYSKRGAVGRPDAAHHAIAYIGQEPRQKEGENLNRHAIQIEPRGSATLHPASRINFSKVYTIEHNVKVKNIGKVTGRYFTWVLYYWQESMGFQPAAQTQ